MFGPHEPFISFGPSNKDRTVLERGRCGRRIAREGKGGPERRRRGGQMRGWSRERENNPNLILRNQKGLKHKPELRATRGLVVISRGGHNQRKV